MMGLGKGWTGTGSWIIIYVLGRNIHLFSSVVWKELCVSTGEDPTVRNPHLQNRGRRKPEECFRNIRLDSDSCEVNVLSLWEAGSLIWKVFFVWSVYIFTFLCVFVVAQVASVNACRWRAAASTISRTGSTCSPNIHTLRWHPHTRLSLSATRWGCTHTIPLSWATVPILLT